MKSIEIIVNGTAYPCSPTMGAMLRFKKETGKEVTEILSGSVSELCTYLYCCVASSAKRAGKDFGLSLMDFADNITPEDMTRWSDALKEAQAESAENDGADDEKKSR